MFRAFFIIFLLDGTAYAFLGTIEGCFDLADEGVFLPAGLVLYWPSAADLFAESFLVRAPETGLTPDGMKRRFSSAASSCVGESFSAFISSSLIAG